jgi:hypothetical protein
MIAAFFELCFTGGAALSSRLAGSTSNLSKSDGTAMADRSPLSRRGTFTNGAGFLKLEHQNSPAPAPLISRKVSFGMYGAMLIFLAFCLAAIVTCPDGRLFHQELEDGHAERMMASQTASGTVTEDPSSLFDRKALIAVCGCFLFSVVVVGAYIINARR